MEVHPLVNESGETGLSQQEEGTKPKTYLPTAQGFPSAFPVADSCMSLDAAFKIEGL